MINLYISNIHKVQDGYNTYVITEFGFLELINKLIILKSEK